MAKLQPSQLSNACTLAEGHIVAHTPMCRMAALPSCLPFALQAFVFCKCTQRCCNLNSMRFGPQTIDAHQSAGCIVLSGQEIFVPRLCVIWMQIHQGSLLESPHAETPNEQLSTSPVQLWDIMPSRTLFLFEVTALHAPKPM